MSHSVTRPWALSFIHLVSLLVARVLPWLLAIVLLRMLADAAAAITGSDSYTAAWISLSSNLKVTRGLSFVFGAMGFLYGVQQRRLRALEQARASARLAELDGELSRLRG